MAYHFLTDNSLQAADNTKTNKKAVLWQRNCMHDAVIVQEAQLPQRNSASAAHTCAADALLLCGSCIGIGSIRHM